MDKKQIVREVAKNCNYAKWEVNEILEAFIGVVSNQLKSGGEVSINNFGRFKHRYYKPRKGSHPRTGESINICDRAVIQFTPSPSIKVSDEVKAMLAQK